MMNRLLFAVAMTLALGGCKNEDDSLPPPPAESVGVTTEESAPPIESADKAELDLRTAMREMEMELKRIELEWDPQARPGVVQRHREDVEALRYRARTIREKIQEHRPHSAGDFARMGERVEDQLDEFEQRMQILDSAIVRAETPPEPERVRAELPQVF